jgi:hypothetical protein
MRIAPLCLSLLSLLPLTAQQTPQEVVTAMKEIQALWPKKAFPEAARRLEGLIQSPGFRGLSPLAQASVHYDLACAYARLGRRSEALAFLGVAAGEGFRDGAHLKVDEDLADLRTEPGFQALATLLKSRGYPALLRQHAAYGREPAPAVAFRFQAKDAQDLTRFREAYHLEEVAGPGDEVARVLNLLHWVHAQVRHDGNAENPTPRNAAHLIEVCRKEGRGVNCRMMATILSEACLALGIPARHVTCLPLDTQDPDCHVITAAWVETLHKWIYLDPTFDATLTDPEGHLLSVPEVRARLVAGDPLVLAKGANWNGKPKDPGEYLDYMAKNLVKLQCPSTSAYGYESWNEPTTYLELDPVSIPVSTGYHVTTTHDPEWFWSKPAAPIRLADSGSPSATRPAAGR